MRAFSRALHSIEFIAFLHTSFLIGSAALDAAEVNIASVVSPAVEASLLLTKHAYSSPLHTNKVARTSSAASFSATPQEGALRLHNETSNAATTAAPISSTAFLPWGLIQRYLSYAVPVPFADSSLTARHTTAVAPTSLPISSSPPAYSDLTPLPTTPFLHSRRLSGHTAGAPASVATLPPGPAAFAGVLPRFPNASTSSPLGSAYLAGVPKESSPLPVFDTSSASLSASPVAPSFTSIPRATIEQLPSVSASQVAASSLFHPAAADQLTPTLPYNAFLPPATPAHTETPLIPGLAYEAVTLPSPKISTPSSTTEDHLITALNNVSHPPATGSSTSYPTESYSPAARESVRPLIAKDSSRVFISQDPFPKSEKDPSSSVGDGALSSSKSPSLSSPNDAVPYDPPKAVSGDEITAGLNVSDVLGTVVAAGGVSLENEEAPKEMQQDQQQEEQPQSPVSREATTTAFACCSGTWAPASHLKSTPAVNIGGPIFSGQYSDETETSLPDEDEAFLEEFAKAKEEFYSMVVKKGRGYSKAHQVRSTSLGQQYNRKLPVTSLATAAPAAAAPAATVHSSATGRLKRIPSNSINATAARGSTRKIVTAATAREVAIAATTIAPVSLVGRTEASTSKSEASAEESRTSLPEVHQRQHLLAGLHTGSGYRDNLTSKTYQNSQVGTHMTLETEQVDSNTAVAGPLNRNTVAEAHGITGASQLHSNYVPPHTHTRAVPETSSNNAPAKALRNRAEANTSGTNAALKQKNFFGPLAPDAGGPRTRGHQEEESPRGKQIVETENGNDASKREGELQLSKAKSPTAESLRRHPRNAEEAVQQRSKEKKDRRIFGASGGTRRAADPTRASLPAAEVAPPGVAVVLEAEAAVSAAVEPTSPAAPRGSPTAAVAAASAATGLAEEPTAARPRPKALLRTRTPPAYASTANTAKGVGSPTRAGNVPIAPSTSTRTTFPASLATTGRVVDPLPVAGGRGPFQPLSTAAVAKSAEVVPTATAKGAFRGRQAEGAMELCLPVQSAPAGKSKPAARQSLIRTDARASREGTRTGGRAAGPPAGALSAAERTQTVRMPAELPAGAPSVAGRLSESTSPLRAPASLPSVVGGTKEGRTAASYGHPASSEGGHAATRSQQQTSVSLRHWISAAAV